MNLNTTSLMTPARARLSPRRLLALAAGAALIALTTTACPDGQGGYGLAERELPDASLDDLAAREDVACADGWSPLTTIVGAGDYQRMAVHEATATLALSSRDTLELWSLQRPGDPILVTTLDAGVLGSQAAWGELAAGEDGFVALGVAGVGEQQHSIVAVIGPASDVLVADEDPDLEALGDAPPWPPTPWAVTTSAALPFAATSIAGDGLAFAIAGPRAATHGVLVDGGIVLAPPRDYGHDAALTVNGVGIAGEEMVVTTAELGVSAFDLTSDAPPREFTTTDNPQRPLRVADTWLIPETSSFWDHAPPHSLPWAAPAPAPGVDAPLTAPPPKPEPDPTSPRADDGAPPWTDDASPAPWFTPIERLHVATGRLDRVGETPVLSAFDAEDGAFDLALRDGALIIANSESGVLRAPWTEDGVTVPEGTTLTPALWEDVPPRPQQLAVLGDRLLILSPHADAVGVTYICP